MKQSTFNLNKLIINKKSEIVISDIACFGNLCCVGTFDGYVIGLTWTGEKFENMFYTRVFKEQAVRKISFSVSGKLLLCGSTDGSMAALKCESGKVKIRVDEVFGKSPLPIGVILSLDENDQTFAIGNDQGDIKILDLTKEENSTVASFDDFDDQVTDMIHLPYRKLLLACSGDGTFLVIDLKQNKVISHSSSQDDEYTCLAVVRDGSFLLFGSGLGEITIYKYNYWGEVADRFPAHPGTVNCLLSESQHTNILYTGCSDGIVRKLSFHPNEIIDELGRLDDSVEKMALYCPNENSQLLLASTCTDEVLTVFNLRAATEEGDEKELVLKKKGKRKLPRVDHQAAAKKAFFSDL